MEKRMRRKRILYIQHATAFGGSVVSLLYLIQGLDQNIYEPIVLCLRHSDVIDFYRSYGIKTINGVGMKEFRHTTLGWYPLYNPYAALQLLGQTTSFGSTALRTRTWVQEISPDVVHLNSLVLAPCAIGVKLAGVPLVWQVREPVHPGHLGLRKRLLSLLVRQLADEVIFISECDKRELVGDGKGEVVYNFVDFERFDRALPGKDVRDNLGITEHAKLVLFLGGLGVVKGVFVLLEALHLAKQEMPELTCIIGAGRHHPSNRLISRVARRVLPILGSGTVPQRVRAMMERYGMHDYVYLLDFRTDVEHLIAASDLVVFPSIEPHFARPVIEAGAMAKPVVASRIGGPKELVDEGKTGLLVLPGDPIALAKAMLILLQDRPLAERLGEQGYRKAKRLFDARVNVEKTVAIYERLLAHRSRSALEVSTER